jgi:hypothetical protein
MDDILKTFGLTDRDIHLLLAAFNGSLLSVVRDEKTGDESVLWGAITPDNLSAEMAASGQVAFEDHDSVGRSLDGVVDDSPEAPFEYLDCAERLTKLTAQQAIALRFYVLGFWAGVAASPQR